MINNNSNNNNNSQRVIFSQGGIQEYQSRSIDYFNKEKYVDSMKMLNVLLEINQNDLVALCNRATCNYRLELYKHCIKDCDMVLNNEPNNKVALLRKAKALKQISSTYPNAIEEIEKLKRQSNESWGYMSINLDDGDDPDDGLKDVQTLLWANHTKKQTSPIISNNKSVFVSTSQNGSPMMQTDSPFYGQINEAVISPLMVDRGTPNVNGANIGNYNTCSPNFNIVNDSEASDIVEQLLYENEYNGHINNNKRKQADFNGYSDDDDCIQNVHNQKITKSDSMEELNKLLEQLSTENIATLISNGNFFVNSGKYKEAIAIFTTVIENNPLIPSSYLGRGTSNAFLGDLDEAIYDFSKAIELDNTSSDAYKRRGQSKVARGMEYEALEDFNQAVAFDKESDYDIYYNRGLLHYQMRNYERALKDFKKVVSIEPQHTLAWNRIGLCLNVNGYPMEAYNAFLQSISIDPNFEASYTNIGQCWRDLGIFDKSLEAFNKALEICPNYCNALHLRGLLFYNSGRHLDAIKDWSIFLQEQLQKEKEPNGTIQPIDPSTNDVKQFRAVTYHSLGQIREALNDYNDILNKSPLHYVFYQKEIALFTHHHLDQPLNTFSIDRSFNPYLKTFQCQRIAHTSLVSYQPQPSINEIIPDVKIISDEDIINKDLLDFAKEMGEKLQYDCEGFLSNSRQKLQCGMAVIEIAQTLKKLWISGSKNNIAFQVDGKSSSFCQDVGGQRADKKHTFGWRDLYDIGVKWRQISEPNDPVWWVDLLSPEQFNEGFGSHTPIVTGQCKVVRYYPMFEKSFEIMKLLIPIQHSSYVDESPTFLMDLDRASTCKDVYKIMNKDFYVVTPCYGLFSEGKVMEGTRLTLQYIHPEGYEFAIRTPGTPARWKQYDEEMTVVFNKIIEKAFTYHQLDMRVKHETANHGSASTKLQEKQTEILNELSDLILALTFYWYNFMPLSRGSAALGFTTLLGLFLSLDIQISSNIPKNQQPDWEAILKPTSSSFINCTKPWLYPARSKFTKSNIVYNNDNSISNNINTIRKMIQVLNLSLK
ncbi:hypothetical protein DICPUDRAFT_146678 [Dictyostelium purpureum]|uniref:Uncharacterized protein n=1 Tax=Dictyostelium purpureum TaxID=5786 RepID=F0Z6L1_DICPU|nr:uncharacterized protein DICPUDRAFT_146678 [Dictyostelium purpureum]EGC40514.1 hypothetical protein DICPUDRAFT_146678 [Dictyostelium purpureum]|eukprot:XP_003283061.1 hypothetical protein DICPUDRAFT_146678 [Dictyostelium purpureum]